MRELGVPNVQKDRYFFYEGAFLNFDDGFDACEPVALASHVGDQGEVGCGILNDFLNSLLIEPVDELCIGVEMD